MDRKRLNQVPLLEIGNSYGIAGIIWSGKGEAFVSVLPGAERDLEENPKFSLVTMTLSEWQLFMKQLDLMEVEVLKDDGTGLKKMILRKSQRQIDTRLQWNVFQRDNYHCRYCGMTGVPLTVDHCRLWEDGGITAEINLITACRPCNKERGNMQYEDWINSNTYKKRSKNISSEVRQKNIDKIKEMEHIKTLDNLNFRSR